MVITQDNLIKQIADREGIDTATIQSIFRSAENIIFDCLSSTAPSENIMIRLLKGINLERKYIDQKKYSKGMFQGMDCPAHVNVRASSSKYYSKKVNDKLFRKK